MTQIPEFPFPVCNTALLKAAKSGDADAQVELANQYWDEEEYDMAVHWFKLARMYCCEYLHMSFSTLTQMLKYRLRYRPFTAGKVTAIE